MKLKLLAICRCGDCGNLTCINEVVGSECGLTRRKLTPQQYCNEGFPEDCPLADAPEKEHHDNAVD